MREKAYPEIHAQADTNDKRMMEGVYAGPDYFASQNPAAFQAVYGGPEFFAPQNPAMFQMAYAAPVPQNGAYGIAASQKAYAAPPSENTKKCKWCEQCHRTIDADAKFCPECGAPQPRDDA